MAIILGFAKNSKGTNISWAASTSKSNKIDLFKENVEFSQSTIMLNYVIYNLRL